MLHFYQFNSKFFNHTNWVSIFIFIFTFYQLNLSSQFWYEFTDVVVYLASTILRSTTYTYVAIFLIFKIIFGFFLSFFLFLPQPVTKAMISEGWHRARLARMTFAQGQWGRHLADPGEGDLAQDWQGCALLVLAFGCSPAIAEARRLAKKGKGKKKRKEK